MSELNQNFFQATEYIVSAYFNKLKFDRTIIAEIVRLKNAEIGEYVVKYEGNEMLAYVTDITNVYKAGDSVCIRIQENDFSKQKFIERKNENKKKGVGQLKTSMIEVESSSPNLIDFNEPLSLIVGPEEEQSVTIVPQAHIGGLSFKDYAAIYNKIQISGIFTTTFMSEHFKGNYGIEIALTTSEKDENGKQKVEILRLDLENFIGNPYHSEEGSLQSAQFEIINNYYTGIAYITFFQENFEKDTILDEEGNEIKLNVPNLEVKDISINFINMVDYSQIDYYIDIKTPDGTRTEENKPVRLQANLKYRGQDILTKDDCICYWFKQNFAITPAHAKYNNNAGSGWELIYPLKKEDEFKPELIIYSEQQKEEEVLWIGRDQEFKLVIVYKEDNYFTDTILIEDGAEQADTYSIKQEVDNEKISLYIDTNNKIGTLGDWYRLSSNGVYEQIETQTSKIDITQYLVNTLNTFYCAIYNNQEFKCNRTIVIKNSEEASDFLVSFEGKDIFSYDSKGNTDYENTEIEQIIIPHIQMANAATKFTMEWYLGETKLKLDDKEFEPSNSMIQKIWYDESMRIHFKIKQKFNNSYTNNTLILKLKLLNSEDKVYEYPKELMFTKDGSQDSNGSTYNLVVRAIDGENIIPMNSFAGVKANSNSELQLKALLFKDGELVDITNKNITWSIKYGDGSINEKGLFTFKSSYYNVIKAEYTDNSVYLAYLFPINSYTSNSLNFNFSLPQFITYDASGYKPDYLQNDLQVPENYILELNKQNFISLTKETMSLNVSPHFNGELKTEEAPYYILTSNNNENEIYYLPIVLQLNTKGNENIQGWDGNSIDLIINSSTSGETDTNKVYEPQVGAGYYDNNNRFNGIIMGKDSTQSHLGLYGYQNGIAYFGLRENGTAFFGSSENTGGQIVFDGKTGTISGGGGGNKTTGMTIQLGAEKDENGKPIDLDTTDAIKIGGGKFYVKYDGQLYADYGTIGGWNLGYSEFYNGESVGYYDNSEEKDFSNSKTILSPYGIFTNQLYICSPDTNKVRKTDGTIEITNKESKGVYYGSFGYVAAARGQGIGITTEKKENPIILETDQSNLRLTAGTTDSSINSIILESENEEAANKKYTFQFGNRQASNGQYYNLYCDVPAEKQYGIYARFA